MNPIIQIESMDAGQVQTPDVEHRTMLGDTRIINQSNRSVLSSKRGSLDNPNHPANLTHDVIQPSALELVIDDFSATQDRENKPQIVLEGDCYLKTKTERFKKHWAVLTGNELYCYRSKEDS